MQKSPGNLIEQKEHTVSKSESLAPELALEEENQRFSSEGLKKTLNFLKQVTGSTCSAVASIPAEFTLLPIYSSKSQSRPACFTDGNVLPHAQTE